MWILGSPLGMPFARDLTIPITGNIAIIRISSKQRVIEFGGVFKMSGYPGILESTAAKFPFSCYDEDRAEDTPGTLHYKIDCLTTGASVKASTEISPATQSGEIDITPTDNALQSQDNDAELKLLTLTADQGTDAQFIKQYRYEVLNAASVP